MGVHAGKFVADTRQVQGEAQMGFFEYGVRCQTAVDELYQYLHLFGRSGRQLAKHSKRTKNEISKFPVP
jgi:hypothetical protein